MSVSRREPGPTTRRVLGHHTRIGWHDHAGHQLIYLRRGVLSVRTDDGVIVLPAGSAVWLPAEAPHAHLAHGAAEFRSVMFPAGINPLGLTRVTAIAATALLGEAMLALTDTSSPRPPAAKDRLREVIVDEMAVADTPRLRVPEPRDPRLRALAAIFARDPGETRPLRALAAEIASSERTLSRLLRDELGLSFPQWRDRLRLFEATIALTQGRTVAATAAGLGYSSSSVLIHSFRVTFGMTPGAVRAAAAAGPTLPPGGRSPAGVDQGSPAARAGHGEGGSDQDEDADDRSEPDDGRG